MIIGSLSQFLMKFPIFKKYLIHFIAIMLTKHLKFSHAFTALSCQPALNFKFSSSPF